MQFSSIFLLALPAVLALPSSEPRNTALEARAVADFANWAPAAAGEVRSPCPALNALANHNILPRSGKGISKEVMRAALAKISYDSTVADSLFLGAGALGLHNGLLDLNALNKHNAIEHDGSLSRADLNTGDNFSFNQTIFNKYIAAYSGKTSITLDTAAKARLTRVKDSKANNPQFDYAALQAFASNGETALLLGAMGALEGRTVPISWVKTFFQEERYPVAEGWTPATKSIGLVGLTDAIIKVIFASGEVIPGLISVSEATLRQLLNGFFGVTA